jgi:hypothetical protein
MCQKEQSTMGGEGSKHLFRRRRKFLPKSCSNVCKSLGKKWQHIFLQKYTQRPPHRCGLILNMNTSGNIAM